MIKKELVYGVTIITPMGPKLDDKEQDIFNETVYPMLEDSKNILFDLKELSFIDSKGFKTLTECINNQKSSGKNFKITGLTKDVDTIFRLNKLNDKVEIVTNKDQAINSMMSYYYV